MGPAALPLPLTDIFETSANKAYPPTRPVVCDTGVTVRKKRDPKFLILGAQEGDVLVAPRTRCGEHDKKGPFHSRLFCVKTPQRPSIELRAVEELKRR
jgi:hypothetical protein